MSSCLHVSHSWALKIVLSSSRPTLVLPYPTVLWVTRGEWSSWLSLYTCNDCYRISDYWILSWYCFPPGLGDLVQLQWKDERMQMNQKCRSDLSEGDLESNYPAFTLASNRLLISLVSCGHVATVVACACTLSCMFCFFCIENNTHQIHTMLVFDLCETR